MKPYQFSMKNIKLKAYYFYFLLIFLLSLVFIYYPFTIYWKQYDSSTLSTNKEDWNLFSAFSSGTVAPLLSLLTLWVTAWIAIEFNNYQKNSQSASEKDRRQQATIDLFKEFRSDRMRNARYGAWKVKIIWDSAADEKFKDEFIRALVGEIEIGRGTIDIQKDDIRAVYDLFAFYNMLSLYEKNEIHIKNLNYFYYGWWRKFLYEIADKYDKRKSQEISTTAPMELDSDFRKEFIHAISFKRTLKQLDKLCGFNDLAEDFSIYKE